MCSLSRYVLVAGAVGLVVSSLTGSGAAGWAAAAAGVLLLAVLHRRFPDRSGGSCELPVPPTAGRGTGDEAQPARQGWSHGRRGPAGDPR